MKLSRRAVVIALLPLALGAAVLTGAVTAAAQTSAAEPAAASALPGTNAPVRQISAGVYQVGQVRIDQQARTVTFPAFLNMNEGPIEYLVVTTTGKTHESLLRTDAEPAHIQVAMLLLGAKGAPGGWFPEPPSSGPMVGGKGRAGEPPAGKTNAVKIPGESVNISASWKAGQGRTPIENFVRDLQAKAPMSRGPFIFNGSRVWNGVFVAQREGSIVSLITDADALFNNPRPGHDLDDVWEILPKELPPLGTPVDVVIALPPKLDQPAVGKTKQPASLSAP